MPVVSSLPTWPFETMGCVTSLGCMPPPTSPPGYLSPEWRGAQCSLRSLKARAASRPMTSWEGGRGVLQSCGGLFQEEPYSLSEATWPFRGRQALGGCTTGRGLTCPSPTPGRAALLSSSPGRRARLIQGDSEGFRGGHRPSSWLPTAAPPTSGGCF